MPEDAGREGQWATDKIITYNNKSYDNKKNRQRVQQENKIKKVSRKRLIHTLRQMERSGLVK